MPTRDLDRQRSSGGNWWLGDFGRSGNTGMHAMMSRPTVAPKVLNPTTIKGG